MNRRISVLYLVLAMATAGAPGAFAGAQSDAAPTSGPLMEAAPARELLVLEKQAAQLDIIDPANLEILGKVPVGADPHEVIASSDGKYAYVSNYMGPDGPRHQLSVVDLVARRALPPIELGALKGPHGLEFAGGKVYFTAETAKVIGRYDPAAHAIDWVLGTGQDRTHMIWVSNDLERIVTSNVSSGTISIIEKAPAMVGPDRSPAGHPQNRSASSIGTGAPAGRGPQNWEVTSVPSGRGSEGFDVSPDGKAIWAANARDGTVTVIDFATKAATASFHVAVLGANRLKFSPNGNLVLISGLGAPPDSPVGHSNTSAPNLVAIDAATRKEIKRLNLGGGSAGILMDPDGTRAFVASSRGNKLVIVNLQTLTVTGQIAPLGEPDGMAWAVRR